MPGDGNCMIHALAYWAGQDQAQVRSTIAQHAIEHWDALFPGDTGDEYAVFMHTTLTHGEWGDGRHLAIASRVYATRIAEVGD